MWNKAVSKGWKDRDHSLAVDKPATVSSSEVSGGHTGTKRLRRPSVRLEEIGDRPAAVVAERKRKKIVLFACPGKNTPHLQRNEPLKTSSKLHEARPLVNAISGKIQGKISCHDDTDAEKLAWRHSEVARCSSGPVGFRHEDLQIALRDASDERPTTSRFLKTVSKEGRNINRKHGGLTIAVSSERPTYAGGSGPGEGDPDIEGAIDMHSEEENDAHTPEGFRDSDLETSDYMNDGRDINNSLESKPSKNGEMSPVQGEEECQSRELYQNGLSRQAHNFEGRTKSLPALAEVSQKGLTGINEHFTERNGDEETSAAVWTGTADNTYVEGTKHLTDANTLIHANKHKQNNIQGSMEPPYSTTDLHFTKFHPPLWNGVRGWLQNLGLGKYAQQFEAHEVDIEVLPLLTFDDLKEMGITAVGSRRKLFFAIQQLGKCSLIKADQ